MDLENEVSTGWTLFGSGAPVYNNRGKLEVDDPALMAPPLTITRRKPDAYGDGGGASLNPMGDVAIPGGVSIRDPINQSNIPPEKRTWQDIDWNDPTQAAQYGTSELRQWNPTAREGVSHWVSQTLTGLGLDKYKAQTVADRLTGTGGEAIGIADLALVPGAALGIDESLHDIRGALDGIDAGREGAFGELAMGVGMLALNSLGLGAVVKGGGRMAARGFKTVQDNAATIAKIGGATAAAGAVMQPDDAEAGLLQKIARAPKGSITKLEKGAETATDYVTRMSREAPILTDTTRFTEHYGEIPAMTAEAPSPAVALRSADPSARDVIPNLPTGEMGDKTTAATPFAQIGAYFDSLTRMKNGGAPRVWSDAAHQGQILDEAASEVRYQLTLSDPSKRDFTKKTGWGWYDEDIQRTFNTAGQVMPELRMDAKRGINVPWEGGPNMAGNTDKVTPAQARILAAAVGAPQSFGNPAARNADIKFQAYEVFRKTGQFPEKGIYLNDAGEVASTGKYWTQRAVSEQYIGVLNTLIREVGPAKAADWLVSEHTIAELRDLKRRATNADGEKIFKGDQSMGISGKADEVKAGAFIFGPKGGQFMGNLLGFPGTTTDMWFSRTWNRYLGTSREGIGALAETGLIEQPRNLAERADMADFSRKLTDQLNQDQALVSRLGRPLTERDTQAVLWYFEQNLYNDMGVNVRPTSFGEGASAYAKRAKEQGGTGIQRRSGDGPNGSAGASAAPPNGP